MEHLVTPGGLNLQSAIDIAEWGDAITVEAGSVLELPLSFADYYQPYFLRNKGVPAEGQEILIRSSAHAGLSGQVGVSDAAQMFKIHATHAKDRMVTPGSLFAVDANAEGWRIVGAELTDSGAAGIHCNSLVVVTDGARGIHFEQCYLHPSEDGSNALERQTEVGIVIGSSFTGTGRTTANIKVTNSRISGFGGVYPGTQEVMNSMPLQTSILDGLILENNFLGGALQCWFPGPIDPFNVISAAVIDATLTSARLDHVEGLAVGDYIAFTQHDPNNFACGRVLAIDGQYVEFTMLHPDYNQAAPDVPDGIATWGGEVGRNYTVRHNTFWLDPELAQAVLELTGSNPKGYIEFKSGEYATLEGNVFDGFPSVIAVNSANQNGGVPWTGCSGLTIRDNHIKRAGSAFNFQFGNSEGNVGVPISKASENILIENNLIGSPEDDTYFGLISGGRNVRALHNTIIGNPAADQNALFVVSDSPGFQWQDNIFNAGQSVNGGALNSSLPTGVEGTNLVINNTAALSNPRADEVVQSHFPNSFVDDTALLELDWSLPDDSPYKGAASDGKDVGVDIPRLQAALAGTAAPEPPEPPVTVEEEYREESYLRDTKVARSALYQKMFAEGYATWEEMAGNRMRFRKFNSS